MFSSCLGLGGGPGRSLQALGRPLSQEGDRKATQGGQEGVAGGSQLTTELAAPCYLPGPPPRPRQEENEQMKKEKTKTMAKTIQKRKETTENAKTIGWFS